MPSQVSTTVAVIIVLFMLSGCGTAAALPPTPISEPTANPENTGTIVLGKVSSKPAEKIQEYQPIAEYLAANLSEHNIAAGEVKVAPDLETMAEWLATGEVDLFFDNPYAALLVGERSGGQPLLVRVKKDEDTKYAVFFGRTDSPFANLADLKGQVIALEEPDSASGYMLPVAHMIEAGLKPVEQSNRKGFLDHDEIGYVFSLDDDNTVQWVFNERIPAGVVDNEAFEEYSAENPGALLKLAETEPVLRHQLTIARSGLEPARLQAIKQLLKNLADTEAGPAVLAPSNTERFDELERWAADVARAEEMYRQVKNK